MMRSDIEFHSRGQLCRGWLYLPDRSGTDRLPAVAMAHGFSATRDMALPAYAEHFANAGFAVLLFDFRYLGTSDGEPRGQIFPAEQHEDYRNAISWLANHDAVDPQRIGVWGTSYSGAHVLYLAAFDKRIKAVVAQVPGAVTFFRQLADPQRREAALQMLNMLAADRTTTYASGEQHTLQVVAEPGQPCILSTPDSWEWFRRAGASTTWRNAVTLQSLEQMMAYDPVGPVELIAPTPALIIAAEQDALVGIDALRETYSRMGEPKALKVLDCGHFDLYQDEPWHTEAASAAVEWFSRWLK